MISEQSAIYIWVLRSIVTEGLSSFTMAMIELLLLALLASSISVRAKSIYYPSGDIGGGSGEVQTDCESFLQ